MRIPKYMSILAVLILLGASFVPVCIGEMITSEPKKSIREVPVSICLGKLSIKWEGSFWTAWRRPEITFEPFSEDEIWINETMDPNEKIVFDIMFGVLFTSESPSPPPYPNWTILEKIIDFLSYLYGCKFEIRLYVGGIPVSQPQRVKYGESTTDTVFVNAGPLLFQQPVCPFSMPYNVKITVSWPCHKEWQKNCTLHFCIKREKDSAPFAVDTWSGAPTKKSVQNVKQSVQNIKYVNLYCGNVNIKWKTPLSPIVEAKVNDTELTVNLPEETADVIWNFICDSTFEPHNLPIIPAIGFYKVSLLEEERNVHASDWTFSYRWGSSEYNSSGIAIGSFTSQVRRNETVRWNVEIKAVAIPIYKSVVAHGEIVVHFV